MRLLRWLALMSAMALLAVGSLTSSTPPALASCAYDQQDPRLIELADVIFSGEIIDDRTVKFDRERRVTFFVSRVYKGEAYRTQVVTSRRYSSSTLNIASSEEESILRARRCWS